MLTFHQLYNSNIGKKILTILRIVLPVTIFYYISTLIEYEELKNSLLKADLKFVFAALITGSISITLQILKWSNIVNEVVEQNYISSIVKSLFAGYAFGLLTPFRAGELPGRSFGLKKSGLTSVMMAVLLDRVYGLAALMITGSVMFAFYLYYVKTESLILPALLPLFIIAVFLFLYKIIRSDNLKRYKLIEKISRIEYLRNVKEAFNRSRRSKSGFHFKQLMLAFLIFVLYTMQLMLLVLAFDKSAPLFPLYTAICSIFFVKAFIGFLSIADLGIRESSAIYLLGALGIASVSAFSASMILFMMNILLPSAIGAILILKKD